MQLGDLGFLGSLTGPLFDPLDDSCGYGREVYGDGRIRLARRWFGFGCEVTEGADGLAVRSCWSQFKEVRCDPGFIHLFIFPKRCPWDNVLAE